MNLLIEHETTHAIAEIGHARLPNEACGLMLPYPVDGKQIIELPNRSDHPADSFEFVGEDAVMALEDVFRRHPDGIPQDIVDNLSVWHTHPGGHVGPSRDDIRSKVAHLKFFVVSLPTKKGDRPVATWY